MLATAPAADQFYANATLPLLAALPRTLTVAPLELLAWTATLFLRPYLTAAEHRAAMRAALERARAEAAAWVPAGQAPGLSSPAPGRTERVSLYLPIWRRAVAGGTALHLLLAQHACEIAELLEAPALPAALHLGLLLPVAEQPVFHELPQPNEGALELLSRALLSRAIGSATFVDQLLMLHAANRGTELTGGWAAPRALAAQLGSAIASCDRSPRRLRAAQPHELARRAVLSGSALAVLAVEAGLAEAEQLANGRRLLLLAALDRALSNENANDRY